ncbi:hypothetical protein P7H22_20650 [Paenibacillus larvae]|nr:hypothetical protein [Paenibacillus larvae]MDT2242277.1 hypothetical protein [Paenibacillus larvae]
MPTWTMSTLLYFLLVCGSPCPLVLPKSQVVYHRGRGWQHDGNVDARRATVTIDYNGVDITTELSRFLIEFTRIQMLRLVNWTKSA